jgi:ubiquinone/menaquinone biosynthesis C-methylase UbiE
MDIKLYDKLAKKYDFATKVVSFGIEEIWRWIFIRTIKKFIKNGVMLDVASATGEMSKLNFKKMYFIEPSSEMIKIMVEKFKKLGFKKQDFEVVFQERLFLSFKKVDLKKEDKEIIILQKTAEDFKIDEKVDLITAFMAVRNFDDLEKGMQNLDKHLKNGGYFAIVEMTKSDSVFAKIILWYMNNIVPIIAGIITGMKKEFKLLGESIDRLEEKDILKNLENYDIVVKKRLLFIATLIIAKKR